MSRLSEKKLGGDNVDDTNGLFMHDNTIYKDVTVPANKNAISAGTVTVDTGKTVTVETGSTWAIV